MRLFMIQVLAVAMLLLGATSASAWRFDLVSAQNGTTVTAPTQIQIQVHFDTEAGDPSGMKVLGTGVAFNTGLVSYNRPASTSNSYLLYTTSKQPYLVPTPGFCDTNADNFDNEGCVLWPGGGPTKVKVDFLSNKLPNAVPGLTGNSTGGAVYGGSASQLANLVFDITGSGSATFSLTFDTNQGDTLADGNNAVVTPTLGSPIVITVVPEPATLGLSLAAIATLAGYYAHRRRSA